MEPSPQTLIAVLRHSHERLASLVRAVSEDFLSSRSYCTDWSVAQVLSHLGSGAEIALMMLDSALSGVPMDRAAIPAIWDTWNAKSPVQQAADGLAANDAHIRRLEGLTGAELGGLTVDFFGIELDAAGLVRSRLSEHAVHTWDVAVSIDPAAVVAPDAVALLMGHLQRVAGRSGRPGRGAVPGPAARQLPRRRFPAGRGGRGGPGAVAGRQRRRRWGDQHAGRGAAASRVRAARSRAHPALRRRPGPARPGARGLPRLLSCLLSRGRCTWSRRRRPGHNVCTVLTVRILGTRMPRIEDSRFLTTGGVYTEDLADERLQGACHVFFVRSPIAHARIASTEVGAALAAPGVIAVFVGTDLGGLSLPVPPMQGLIDERMSQPLLARDLVRYAGEAVAVIVTEHPYQAEDAAGLVDIAYDPLAPVLDTDAAAAATAQTGTLLFPNVGTNVAASVGNAAALRPDLFDGCEVVVSAAIVNQRVAPAPMETRAAAAVWGEDGRLTAWVPSQGAQLTRMALARMLMIEPAKIRVITPDVGGAFGAKSGADPEHAVVAWVAQRLGRPVRWTESRHDNLIAMTHGRAQRQTVTIGGRRDGTVEAYRLEIVQDAGAYPRTGAFLPALTVRMAPGPYAFPRVEAIAKSVVTTTTPVGSYRGAGRPEATAAVERAMDLFAGEIGADPADVRRRNLLAKFTEPHKTALGVVYDSGDYVAALEKVLAAAGYQSLREEQARRRAGGGAAQFGIGISCYVQGTGPAMEPGGPCENATVEVHPDGSATILTGTSPHGQGHATAWAMLASEELGVPVDKITLQWGDTDLVPDGGGTRSSRSLQHGGVAVHQASRELIEVARGRAAGELEANPADLVFDADRSAFTVIGRPAASVSLASLAEQERLLVRTVFTAPGPTFPFGAHVAVVEVDTETGKVVLLRVVALDDGGTVINPLLAEGQRHGGIAQGVGQALLEEVVYDSDGNPLTASFADYPLLSASDLPSFELVDMETPTVYNSLGAKGIGEAGTIGSTPAVQNAVIDAVAHLGVRHIDMPASPQRVWQALQQAAAGSSSHACPVQPEESGNEVSGA